MDHYFSSSLTISRGLNYYPKWLFIITIHEQWLIFLNRNTFILKNVTNVTFVNYEEF